MNNHVYRFSVIFIGVSLEKRLKIKDDVNRIVSRNFISFETRYYSEEDDEYGFPMITYEDVSKSDVIVYVFDNGFEVMKNRFGEKQTWSV